MPAASNQACISSKVMVQPTMFFVRVYSVSYFLAMQGPMNTISAVGSFLRICSAIIAIGEGLWDTWGAMSG